MLYCFVLVAQGITDICLIINDRFSTQPKDEEKKSELLPPGWNESKELYALRYRSNDDRSNLLLKAFTVDSTLIFNLMVIKLNYMRCLSSQMTEQCQMVFNIFCNLLQDSTTEKVTDLTVNVSEYVEEANLQTYERFVNLFGAISWFLWCPSVISASCHYSYILLQHFLTFQARPMLRECNMAQILILIIIGCF